MKTKIITVILSFITSLILISCGTSTGSRYSSTESKETKTEKVEKKNIPPETFDITPYRTKLVIPGSKKVPTPQKLNAWYSFKAKPDTGEVQPTFAGKAEGFRVQVYSTDNLAHADSIKTSLYLKTNQRAVYIDFEPPFYTVKVGDFLNYHDAKNFSFKLNQIGYPDARVVNDSVNVFK